MATRVQSTTEAGVIRRFRFDDDDKKPSWKRVGTGRASMQVQTHDRNKYLSFHITEHSHETDTQRATYITLESKDAAELYAWLKTHFEPTAVL